MAASSDALLEWSAEEEIQLFFALEGLKPVGVNKHFYISIIAQRLSSTLNRDVSAKAVWAHLRTMYNLDTLDALEPLPFPNDEKEFSLPDSEFSLFLSKKLAESEAEEEKFDGESAGGGGPPSIIAVANDNTEKSGSMNRGGSSYTQYSNERKVEIPKRIPKRTRGSMSMSLESNSSPSTTPPPVQTNKRRRI